MCCNSLFLVVAGCDVATTGWRYPSVPQMCKATTYSARSEAFVRFLKVAKRLAVLLVLAGTFQTSREAQVQNSRASAHPLHHTSHSSAVHVLWWCGDFFFNRCPFVRFHMPPITRSTSSKLAIAVPFLSPHNHAHSGFLTNHRAVRSHQPRRKVLPGRCVADKRQEH